MVVDDAISDGQPVLPVAVQDDMMAKRRAIRLEAEACKAAKEALAKETRRVAAAAKKAVATATAPIVVTKRKADSTSFVDDMFEDNGLVLPSNNVRIAEN